MRKLLAVLVGLVVGACQPSTYVPIDENDPEMLAASAEAQRTLPAFWAAYDSDPEARASAMLKVGLPGKGTYVEHIWADGITREGEVIRGRLANRPEHLPGLVFGSEIVIQPSQISDWAYTKGDLMWGAFTQRVMIGRLAEAEAAELRAELSPTPLESGQ